MTLQVLADWAKLEVDTGMPIPENQHNPGYFLKSSCIKSQSKPIKWFLVSVAATCMFKSRAAVRASIKEIHHLASKFAASHVALFLESLRFNPASSP